MRLVIDTNVVVSALLHPGRTPDLAVEAAAEHTLLVDARIEAEYRSVLNRRKFASIDPARREALLARLLSEAERVEVEASYEGAMIDGDDRMFVEVALAGAADFIVTGNRKHFPDTLGVSVVGPTELLERL